MALRAAGFFAEAVRDSFVFAPTLGHNSATGWNPTMDAGQNGPAAFGNVAAFSSEIHDETHGHTFMADSIHDAMTAQPFAGSQLHTHHGDFHIV